MKEIIRKQGTLLALTVFVLSTSWTVTTGAQNIGLGTIIDSMAEGNLDMIPTVIVDATYCDYTSGANGGCKNHNSPECPTAGVGGAKQVCTLHSESGKVYCDCQKSGTMADIEELN